MKKVKITQEQYGKILNNLNESRKMDKSPLQENIFIPEFHQAIHDLIQNIWLNPSQEGLDKTLVQYGVTWGDIISYLTTVGVVAAMGSGVYKVKNFFKRKFSKNPEEAQREKQEEVEKITQMIEKDPKAPWSKNRLKGDGQSTQVNLTKMGRTDAEPNELTPRMSTEENYYSAEAHPDSPEAQTIKKEPAIQTSNSPQTFRGLAMGSEIAILDGPDGKYAFYYDDIPREELPNPNYQLNMDDVTDYVNANIGKIQKGEGVKDFEQMPLVKIDDALKNELLNLYSKDKTFVAALQKLDETTGAASSGAFTGPMSGPANNGNAAEEINTTIKDEEKPIEETTTAGGGTPQASSSGQYTQPKIWAKNKANWAPAQKTQYKGGEMVSFDSCTKLNNNKAAQNGKCSQGAKDHVVKLRKTKDSAIYEQIAKKTGRTMDEVKKLIESKTNKNKSL